MYEYKHTHECGKQRLLPSAFICYSPPYILSILSYFNSGITDLNSLVHKHTPQIHCLYLSRARNVGSITYQPSICVDGDLIFGICIYVAHNGSNLSRPGAVTSISSFHCRKLKIVSKLYTLVALPSFKSRQMVQSCLGCNLFKHWVFGCTEWKKTR